MKKLLFINICILFLMSIESNAQDLETNYVRGKSSTYCASEYFTFSFNNSTFQKIDSYNGSVINGHSKIIDSNYDNNGHYYELRSSDFVLDEYGIDVYRKSKQYNHKILYEKRGGDLLYIFEHDNQNGIDRGKFYFTEKGKEIYCK